MGRTSKRTDSAPCSRTDPNRSRPGRPIRDDPGVPPTWQPDRMRPEWTRHPRARLRQTRSRREWTLYWRDKNLRFHPYELTHPTADVAALLQEVEQDPTLIFWG
jgi:hypothetical protein